MISHRGRLCAGAFVVLSALVSGCDDPADPPEPVQLDGTYEAFTSAFGPLPIRFDTILDPPDSGEWWYMWIEEVRITFQQDGRFRMTQVVRDSFPRDGDVVYSEWWAEGMHAVHDDTVLIFEVTDQFTKFGPGEGRVRGEDRIRTTLFGLLYERVDSDGS